MHTFHGIHLGEYGFIKAKIYILIERFLSVFTSGIIAVSNGELSRAIGLKIAKTSKMTVIREWSENKREKG